MSVSQLHVTQLHAVDMCHARTDARTATALSQEWGAQDLVALRVVSAWPKVRKGRGAVAPSMTLSAESPCTTWGSR
jgi:hypothetical protein